MKPEASNTLALLGVYLLLPVIKREMKEYLADRADGRLLELGKADADESQLVDASGRNRAAQDVAAGDPRTGEDRSAVEAGGRRDREPDDDGFGRGGPTTPYPPPGRRRRDETATVRPPRAGSPGRRSGEPEKPGFTARSAVVWVRCRLRLPSTWARV